MDSSLWLTLWARRLGLGAVVRRLTPSAPILCYHNVVPAALGQHGEPSLHVTQEELDEQCRWVKKRYTVVGLDELVTVILQGKSVRGLAAYTFDDGYVGVLRHGLPVLAAHAFPCTLFVVASAAAEGATFWWDRSPEAAANEKERCLQDLQGDGVRIMAGREGRPPPDDYRAARFDALRAVTSPSVLVGAHSATHRNLATLNAASVTQELGEPRATISRALGRAPEFFAYPYGRWNPLVRDAIAGAGYRAAFGAGSGLAGPGADRWAIPRIAIPRGLPPSQFADLVTGFDG